MAHRYRIASVVRGYHVYQTVWDAVVGEMLVCAMERTNPYDRFAVGVYRNDSLVGHVPRKFSAACSLFLRRGSVILCEVIGGRSYSHDLPQGGLEIPCVYVFQGDETDISKIKKFFTVVYPVGLLNEDKPSDMDEPPQ